MESSSASRALALSRRVPQAVSTLVSYQSLTSSPYSLYESVQLMAGKCLE